MKRASLLLPVALLNGCAATWASRPDASAPFFADRELPRVEVKLNGQGPFRFLVDTGADGCLVGKRAAARLGLKLGKDGVLRGVGGRERANAAVLESLSVGGLEAHDVRVAVAIEPLDVDGILGYQLLKGYRVTFDYPAARVTFEKSPPPEPVVQTPPEPPPPEPPK